MHRKRIITVSPRRQQFTTVYSENIFEHTPASSRDLINADLCIQQNNEGKNEVPNSGTGHVSDVFMSAVKVGKRTE